MSEYQKLRPGPLILNENISSWLAHNPYCDILQ